MRIVYSRSSTAPQSLLRQRQILTEAGLLVRTEGVAEGFHPADGVLLEEVRAAFQDNGASIAALARAHGVSRVAVRTAIADLLPANRTDPDHLSEQPRRRPLPFRTRDAAPAASSNGLDLRKSISEAHPNGMSR
ncbi:hypothetical protein [Streptosporangium roseum]|uniref:hypothetical protein n=1 Tax=Streptosporangium roseum TaxID=2001 RepID=UPI00332230DC